MTFEEVMTTLESCGDAQTKKTLGNHGAKEPYFGVKVAELKKILKKKPKRTTNYPCSYMPPGNSDANVSSSLIGRRG